MPIKLLETTDYNVVQLLDVPPTIIRMESKPAIARPLRTMQQRGDAIDTSRLRCRIFHPFIR
jgi:hypothetical protein